MALLHILLKGANKEAYNIANEESNVSIRTLAELVAELSGRKVVFDIPEDARLGNTTPITKAIFSTQKLEQLGWHPISPLREGMQHTIDTFLSTLML